VKKFHINFTSTGTKLLVVLLLYSEQIWK